jgi:O-antigen/teichoic acid export membrane protein
MNLRQKTFKGLFWSFLSQGGRQVIQIIITTILARLLSPNNFGTLAMVTVFTNFAMIFNEMGVGGALIQKQDTHDRHYYSIFWLNIMAGIGLTLIFIAASPYIAWFYKKPELKPILCVIAFNFLFSSFTTIQQAILTKEMDFRRLAIRDVIALVLSGIIGITLAYRGFGVWSLVYQLISYTIINASLLWILSPWRPKLEFAMTDIKDLFRFSANLTGFNILNYFSRNIDQLLIGKFLGSEVLGYYSLAYKIMLYPLQNISWVILKVMFPAFSKIQDNLKEVSTIYLKMIKAISLVTFPLMAWLFCVAPELVDVFLGEKWKPIVILIKIFCFCGIAQSIGTTVGTIYLSKGKVDLQLKLQLLGTFIVTITILIGLRYGITGVCLAYTIQAILWVLFNMGVVLKLISAHWSDLRSALLSATRLFVVLIILLTVLRLVLTTTITAQLTIMTLCAFVIYITYLFILKEFHFINGKLKVAFLK